MAATEEPFLLSDMIKGHQRGLVDLEISNAIRDLTATAMRVNAPGSITIKINVKPQKTQDGDSVLVAIDHTVTLPKVAPDPSLYFVGDDGRPQKRSPRQPLANDNMQLPHLEREV